MLAFKVANRISLQSERGRERTIDVGFGGFTGMPLGLTGARVPSASPFLCSRWILDFLEIGMACGVECCGSR